MQVFITGVGTDVGKTVVSSWLAIHTNWSYFKPIQTGQVADSQVVQDLIGRAVYPCIYHYQAALSPHLAASMQDDEIDITKIVLPKEQNLIVEGAGGVLVPINSKYLMLDLIKLLAIPTIVVTGSYLGNINHTLLTLEALRARDIPIFGVIVSGNYNKDSFEAIEFYGHIDILANLTLLDQVNYANLAKFPISKKLKQIFNI